MVMQLCQLRAPVNGVVQQKVRVLCQTLGFVINCIRLISQLAVCSMLGQDSSGSNYPGRIPQGLDLPSDVAHEKHPEKGGMN